MGRPMPSLLQAKRLRTEGASTRATVDEAAAVGSSLREGASTAQPEPATAVPVAVRVRVYEPFVLVLPQANVTTPLAVAVGGSPSGYYVAGVRLAEVRSRGVDA